MSQASSEFSYRKRENRSLITRIVTPPFPPHGFPLRGRQILFASPIFQRSAALPRESEGAGCKVCGSHSITFGLQKCYFFTTSAKLRLSRFF